MGVSVIYAAFQFWLFDISRRYLSIYQLYLIGVPLMSIYYIFLVISWFMTAFANHNLGLSIAGVMIHAIGSAMTSSLHTVTTSLLCKPKYGGKYLGYMTSAEGFARVVCPLLLPLIYEANNALGYFVTDILGVIQLLFITYFAYATRNCTILKKIPKQKEIK